MAWSESSQNGYLVSTTTLTTKAVGNGTSNITSVIDFIPPGKDFIVIANSASTNLSTSTHVELFVGYSTAGTFYRWKPGIASYPFLASRVIDNTCNKLWYDVSAYGEFPYYKLKIPLGGGSVTLKVIVPTVKE